MPESPAAEVWTVGRIIDWTTQHLKKHGSESPRLEAEILLAHARRCPRIQLYVQYNEPVTDEQRAVMRDLVKRRAQAEPVAYLVGHREFFGLDFRVSPAVLIPRPETETLVLEALTEVRRRFSPAAIGSPAKAKSSSPARAETVPEESTGNTGEPLLDRPPRILDLGTGTGCIAISLAINLPKAEVTAVDISRAALEIARENAGRHDVAGRLRFLEGDLFAAIPSGERFDIIASNPPYVSDACMQTLPADVRLHEPALALQAGPQGLDVVARLIASAADHLEPGGRVLIEISPEQATAVVELFAAQPAFEPPRVIKDPAGLQRIVSAIYSPP